MLSYNKTMTLKELLNLSRQNPHKTHGSMGSMKGSYGLNKEDIDYIFKNYAEVLKLNIGLQEKPLGYTMMRGDFDFKSSNIVFDNEFNLEQKASSFFKIIREFLKIHLIKTKENKNYNNIVFLTKPSYVCPIKNVRKYGFHWCIPDVFLSLSDFEFFESKMKEKNIDGFDPMSKTPWLMYGQSKNEYAGTYTIGWVQDKEGNKVDYLEYFKNYKLYDVLTEDRIKLDLLTVNLYLPQILSILLFGRTSSDLYIRAEPLQIEYKEKEEYEVPQDLSDLEEDVKSLISILSPHRANGTREDWLKIGWILFNVSNGAQTFLNIWKEFSSSYKFYDENICDKEWDKAQNRGLLIGTLHKLARDDNPEAYFNLIFKLKLCKTSEEKDFITIPLDNIRPDETIDVNNIGSYVPRLEKADIVMMRSNMMTFKTQNLKELFNSYKTILVVSFRVSLILETLKQFQFHNFELYSNFTGKIECNRLVCQIDSLYKVRGHFDLLILDEVVYTLDHINSFVKKKKQVWEALTQYLNNSNKVIACDALLDNRTIKILKNTQRKTHIVENLWQSFKGKKINYIPYKSLPSLIEYIFQQLELHGSLYIPSNSKTLAEKLYLYAKNKNISIGIDTSDNEPIPSSEWKNYKIFVTTPTNVAGVSCNDEFGKTIAYGTSTSCSAQMFAQMLLRVRNTKCQEMDIIYRENTFGENYPTSIKEVKQWVKERDDLIFSAGLSINHIRDILIEDDYYNQYISFIQNQNKSKKWFIKILKGIFEAHGFESIDLNLFYSNKLSECKTEEEVSELLKKAKEQVKHDNLINKEAKQIHDEFKQEIRVNVCNARDISEDEFKKINDKYQKTPEEKLEIRKYHIIKTYGVRNLTESFIKTYEKIIPQYYNLMFMNTSESVLQCYIENEYDDFLEKHKKDESIDRLHEKNNLLKLWSVHNIIKMLGFKDIWDKKDIQNFPYAKAKEFLSWHHHKISILFGGNSKTDWEELLLDDKDDKMKIVKTINGILKKVCNIGVKNKHKGKRKTENIFNIQGLDIWEKENILIPINSKANQIQNDHIYYVKDEETNMLRKRTQDELNDCSFKKIEDVRKRTKVIHRFFITEICVI
jgi:hypothetical protein